MDSSVKTGPIVSKPRRTRLASPPQRAALPLKTAMIRPQPRIADDNAIYSLSGDHVEELASTPTVLGVGGGGRGITGAPNGSSPIMLATEFGHMMGHRMSVASIASESAVSGGDDLPGAKARRILGIKTSSGFDDAELDDNVPRGRVSGENSSVSAGPLSFRSRSPSFLTAVRGVVRRGSLRTPSLLSTGTTDDDEEDGCDAHQSESTHSSDDFGLMRRRPSFSNLFGLTRPREQLQPAQHPSSHLLDPSTAKGRSRSNSVDTAPRSSLPHYRKAKTSDAFQQVDLIPGTPKTPTTVEWMLGPQMETVQSTRRRFASAGDADLSLTSAHNASVRRDPHAVDRWRACDPDSNESHSSSSTSSMRGSSELPSLVGGYAAAHEDIHRSVSPSSLWSCETGSSMSWEALMTRSASSNGHGVATPERSTVLPPTRQSSLAKKTRPFAQHCQLEAPSSSSVQPSLPVVPLMSWSNSSPLGRRAAIGRPLAPCHDGNNFGAVPLDDDAAFAKPRRAPKPPNVVPVYGAAASHQSVDDVNAKQLPVTPHLPPCDDIFIVSRDSNAHTNADSPSPPSSSNTLASLIPSYYLRSPSVQEMDYTVVVDEQHKRPSQDTAVFVGDDVAYVEEDDQLRAVLQAESEYQLRSALRVPASLSGGSKSTDIPPLPPSESPNTKERPSLSRIATDSAVATPNPPLPSILSERRTMSADDGQTLALRHHSAMIVPVDEEGDQQELLSMDPAFTADSAMETYATNNEQAPGSALLEYDCPDARRSIEDALDSIILDLPSRSATKSIGRSTPSYSPPTKPLPLRIDVTKKAPHTACASPRSMLPLKSPLRSKPKYSLPIS